MFALVPVGFSLLVGRLAGLFRIYVDCVVLV